MNKEDQDALVERIEKTWFNRAKAQELHNPKSMKYRRAELEFFMGAITAIDAMDKTPRAKPDDMSRDVPIRWLINAMSGDMMTHRREPK